MDEALVGRQVLNAVVQRTVIFYNFYFILLKKFLNFLDFFEIIINVIYAFRSLFISFPLELDGPRGQLSSRFPYDEVDRFLLRLLFAADRFLFILSGDQVRFCGLWFYLVDELVGECILI